MFIRVATYVIAVTFTLMAFYDLYGLIIVQNLRSIMTKIHVAQVINNITVSSLSERSSESLNDIAVISNSNNNYNGYNSYNGHKSSNSHSMTHENFIAPSLETTATSLAAESSDFTRPLMPSYATDTQLRKQLIKAISSRPRL